MTTKAIFPSEPMFDSEGFNDFNLRNIQSMIEILEMKTKLQIKVVNGLMPKDIYEKAMDSLEKVEQVLVDSSRYRNVLEVKNRQMIDLHRTNSALLKELKFLKDDKG